MKKRVLLITASAIIVCIVCFVIFASLNDDGNNDSKLVQGEFEANTEAPIKATVDAVTTTTVPTMKVSKKPAVQPEETQEPTVAPVETIAPTVKPTKVPTVKPTVSSSAKPIKTIIPTKTPTKKPTNKATAKPTTAPKTKKPGVVGDGYVDPYTGKWFESEEAFKEWCKEELAKQTPTPVPRTETEKTESKYYSRKGTFKLVYDQEGYLDIKNTILGLSEEELDDKDEGIFFDSKGVSRAMEEYSNIYSPSLLAANLQRATYDVGCYPYYDIRDYQFAVPIYDKNGIWVSDKWFYFDKNFNIVVGDHHGMESWLAFDAYQFPDVSPEEVIDNNPNYYKKDIVKFVYNDDASANLKESIFGADADIGEVFEFVIKSKEIIQLLNSTETANIAHYSLSTRDDLIWVYHYDVRDYEFSISLNGGEKEVYYWDENFNMVKK